MTIAVTIKNEDTRDSAVILVKHSGEQVHELAAGQATTVHVWAGSNIEIAERPIPVPSNADGASADAPPA